MKKHLVFIFGMVSLAMLFILSCIGMMKAGRSFEFALALNLIFCALPLYTLSWYVCNKE